MSAFVSLQFCVRFLLTLASTWHLTRLHQNYVSPTPRHIPGWPDKCEKNRTQSTYIKQSIFLSRLIHNQLQKEARKSGRYFCMYLHNRKLPQEHYFPLGENSSNLVTLPSLPPPSVRTVLTSKVVSDEKATSSWDGCQQGDQIRRISFDLATVYYRQGF
jgi:hypothetical protein